jgi:hypothetical protein
MLCRNQLSGLPQWGTFDKPGNDATAKIIFTRSAAADFGSTLDACDEVTHTAGLAQIDIRRKSAQR